jgi:hypothetical protein
MCGSASRYLRLPRDVRFRLRTAARKSGSCDRTWPNSASRTSDAAVPEVDMQMACSVAPKRSRRIIGGSNGSNKKHWLPMLDGLLSRIRFLI